MNSIISNKSLLIYLFVFNGLVFNAQTLNRFETFAVKSILETKDFLGLDWLIEEARKDAISKVIETSYSTTTNTKESNLTGTEKSAKGTRFRTSESKSNLEGIWIKDITPPEITYTKKGKEKWITVKVHGYVAKRPNKTEARELLLKQLSAKPLMEDVQVHSIEYYPNDFIVSAVVLDKRIHTNEANINTEARMIAESNLQEAVIIGNYRKAYGWVPSVEFLTTLKGTTDHHVVYIFIKEVEEE
jgi:hypothetical protein